MELISESEITISKSEMAFMDSEEAVQFLIDAGAPANPESAREFINSMDVSNTGSVTFDEFKQAGPCNDMITL